MNNISLPDSIAQHESAPLFSEPGHLFGVPLLERNDLFELAFRFALNTVLAIIIIRIIYYRYHKKNDHLFTFFLFNITIFFVCAMMRNLQIGIGFAFGLFALFGLLRYRTEPMLIKDMTYLFVVICLAMINAMFSRKISYAELLFVNGAIACSMFLLEFLMPGSGLYKMINFEKIELIKPENESALIAELTKRTGMKVYMVEVEAIDYLRDTAKLKVYYKPK